MWIKWFKFVIFVMLAFLLGYSQGWWRSYQSGANPQPLLIVTLQSYGDNPILKPLFWEKLEKVIPYRVVIEKVENLDALKARLASTPVKAHLLFLERQDLLKISEYYEALAELSSNLLDRLQGDFLLEPKQKYFPILWGNEACQKNLKVWGFSMPRSSRKANRKSLAFLDDMSENPVSVRLLELTHLKLTLQGHTLNESELTNLRSQVF